MALVDKQRRMRNRDKPGTGDGRVENHDQGVSGAALKDGGWTYSSAKQKRAVKPKLAKPPTLVWPHDVHGIRLVDCSGWKIGIDPGTHYSAIAARQHHRTPVHSWYARNEDILAALQAGVAYKWVAIEMVAMMGMRVGQEVFETVLWTGRFESAIVPTSGAMLITRNVVKMAMCGSSRAKPGNIIQAVRDHYWSHNGNHDALRGVASHRWDALAVLLTAEQRGFEPDRVPGKVHYI